MGCSRDLRVSVTGHFRKQTGDRERAAVSLGRRKGSELELEGMRDGPCRQHQGPGPAMVTPALQRNTADTGIGARRKARSHPKEVAENLRKLQ